MKTFTIIFAVIINLYGLLAQNPIHANAVLQCSKFVLSKPLSEYSKAGLINQAFNDQEASDSIRRLTEINKVLNNNFPVLTDNVLQTFHGNKTLPELIVNWQGYSGDTYPPDPTGAAGPNHYMQGVNASVLVFNKVGKSLSGIVSLSKFFGEDDGDPIVLYDKYADRWLISELGGNGNKIHIAISKTADPTGQYFIYQFTSPHYPDYLKFSIWSNGYFMTSNQRPQELFIFERDKMLKGDSTAREIHSQYTTNLRGYNNWAPLPADADGQLPPYDVPCPVLCTEDNNIGGSADQIVIYNATVDWLVSPPTINITLNTKLPVSPFNSVSTGNDITQPGTNIKLDAVSFCFMFRAQYRRWSGYNTIVLNQSVQVGNHWGIRWYELRQDEKKGIWSVFQQGTYSPDSLSRWMGSIAMDDNGSIALAYTVTGVNNSINTYPSIRFTGRNSTDPPGVMTYTEKSVFEGTKPVTNPTGRFGDYSQMTLDPLDGSIFWFTGEYGFDQFSGIYHEATRIFSFKIPYSADNVTELQENPNIEIYSVNRQIIINAGNIPLNSELTIELFDLSGRQITGKKIKPVTNTIDTSFSTIGLDHGVYLVRISTNAGLQKVIKVMID